MTVNQELAARRAAIDWIDDRLLEQLVRRYAESRALQSLKCQAGLPARDREREAEVVRRLVVTGTAAGLPTAPLRALLAAMLSLMRNES